MTVRGAPITNLADALNRDCVLIKKGDSVTVKVEASLAALGWVGGTFFRWVDDGSGEPCLGLSYGVAAGYAVFGSGEEGDQYTSLTGQNTRYSYVNLFYGNAIFATRNFERHTYASRNGVGPLVPLTYKFNGLVYVSENGLLTTEDESDPAVNAGGLFPDGEPITAPFSPVGVCAVTPQAQAKGYLFAQMF